MEADKDKSADHLVEQLKLELQAERNKNKALQDEIKALKEQNIKAQAATEQEEEQITNTLLKKMEQLKKERDSLALQVEQEEEYLTNTLQKKLSALAKEKVDLENRLEAEEEYIVNKLQGQLNNIMSEKAKLEQRLAKENQEHEEMKRSVSTLQHRITLLEAEKKKMSDDAHHIAEQLERLKREKTLLDDKLHKEHAMLTQISQEKAALESEREILDEREFNLALKERDRSNSFGGASSLPPALAASVTAPIVRRGSGSGAGIGPGQLVPPLLAGSPALNVQALGSPPASASGTGPGAKLRLSGLQPSPRIAASAHGVAPISPRIGMSPHMSPHLGLNIGAALSPRGAPTSPRISIPQSMSGGMPGMPPSPGRSAMSANLPPHLGGNPHFKLLKEGWLRMKSATVPSEPFARFWCVLYANEELWAWADTATFRGDGQPIDPPTIRMNLDRVKSIRIVDSDEHSHRFTFEVKTNDADLLLAAESKDHLQSWFSQVRDLCPSIKS